MKPNMVHISINNHKAATEYGIPVLGILLTVSLVTVVPSARVAPLAAATVPAATPLAIFAGCVPCVCAYC